MRHYIFVLFLLSSFSLALSQRPQIGCLPYLMQVWNVLHAARWKCSTQKKSPKIRHLGTIAQICRAIFSQLRHVSTIGKNLLNNNISTTSLQYGELRPTSGWDRFVTLGHASKFQRVSRFGFVTAAASLNRSQPNFAWYLAISWAGTLYIHFLGLLSRDGILPGATFTLRPNLALSSFGSVTARHSSSGHQPNFAALNRGRHLC